MIESTFPQSEFAADITALHIKLVAAVSAFLTAGSAYQKRGKMVPGTVPVGTVPIHKELMFAMLRTADFERHKICTTPQRNSAGACILCLHCL
jgi:hypothetical protein